MPPFVFDTIPAFGSSAVSWRVFSFFLVPNACVCVYVFFFFLLLHIAIWFKVAVWLWFEQWWGHFAVPSFIFQSFLPGGWYVELVAHYSHQRWLKCKACTWLRPCLCRRGGGFCVVAGRRRCCWWFFPQLLRWTAEGSAARCHWHFAPPAENLFCNFFLVQINF